MNAIQALNLRKPDVRQSAASGTISQDVTSRYATGKRSNIKDILVRNFFRKYPLPSETTDLQQLQIERQVAQDMDRFVQSNQQINTKNLNELEAQLARSLNLSKRHAVTGRGGEVSAASGIASAAGRAQQVISPQGQYRKSAQRYQLNRQSTNRNADGKGFQLPQINSHAVLGVATRSVESSRVNNMGKLPPAQRRSQVVNSIGGMVANSNADAFEAQNVYGSKGMRESRGLAKLGSNSQNATGSRDLLAKQMGLAQSATAGELAKNTALNAANLRNLSMAAAAAPTKLYPTTTKEEAADKLNPLMSTLDRYGKAESTSKEVFEARAGARSTRLSNGHGGLRKVPPGAARSVVVEDIPSDISADEWGEIQKFGQRLHEEQVRKQKADHNNRVKQVREVLDQQVKLRAELRDKNLKEKEAFDKRLLDQAKKELELENKQKQELQKKVLEQKRMRDVMLEESKKKQVEDQQRYQHEEKERVQKLAADLEDERKQKAQKKIKEREAALKVIKDNMNEKKKRMLEAEEQKRADAVQVEKNMKLQLQREQAREAEMVERGKRIQKIMDSMGDAVRDNGKELQLKQEREYIQQCIEKDEQAHLQDIDKRNKNRQKHQRLNEELAQQVKEKQLKQENDAKANVSYMNRWMEMADQEQQRRALIEQQRKKKMLANQQFLRDQMDVTAPNASVPVNSGSEFKNRKKYQLGGMMNPEEARMNRALLQEISRAKRGEEPTTKLAIATKSPI